MRLQTARPVCERADPDATFVQGRLLTTKRIVFTVQRRMSDVSDVGILQGFNSTVIARKDDQSIGSLVSLFESRNELADLGIELRNHRCQSEAGILFFWISVKGDVFIDLFVLVGSVYRRMNRMKWHINEPWASFFVNPPHSFCSHKFGGISFLIDPAPVAVPRIFKVPFAVFMRPRVGRTRQGSVSSIEAKHVRPPLTARSQMPFATLYRVVPLRFQGRSHRHCIQRHRSQVAW